MVVILTLHGELQNDSVCLCIFTNIYVAYISLDPALPGSIMRSEGSNISRCKPFFGVQLLKQGLHLHLSSLTHGHTFPSSHITLA